MDSKTTSKKSADIELDEDSLIIGSNTTIAAVKKAKNAKKKGKTLLGKTAIFAEDHNDTAKHNSKNNPNNLDAHRLNRDDLLSEAAKIEVNGSNLKSIYDTRLINEHGLRRLVDIYYKDQDIGPALRHEIIEETSHLSDYQSAFNEKIGVFKSRRMTDAIVVALITTAIVLTIVFMVNRF